MYSIRMENQWSERAQPLGETSENNRECEARDNEMSHSRILDAEFAKLVASPDIFGEQFGQRPLVASLKRVRHEVDGQTIYEHTRQLLQSLRTDEFRDIHLGNANVRVPDLLRAVGLYHDAEKSLMESRKGEVVGWKKPSLKAAKLASLESAFSELSTYQPELLVDTRTRILFDELIRNSFYFGYNLNLLKLEERQFNDDGEALLEKVLLQPISRLHGHGLDVEPEALFAVQFALSRADSLAIGPYKKNLPELERLRSKLLDLIN